MKQIKGALLASQVYSSHLAIVAPSQCIALIVLVSLSGGAKKQVASAERRGVGVHAHNNRQRNRTQMLISEMGWRTLHARQLERQLKKRNK